MSICDSKPHTCVAIQMYLQQTPFPILVRIPMGKLVRVQNSLWYGVNDSHLNFSEGVKSMEWQQEGGPQDNISVLEPQNDNYGR